MGSRFFIYKVCWDALRQEFDGTGGIRTIPEGETGRARGILARTLTRYRVVRDYVDSEIPPTQSGCAIIWLCVSPPNSEGFASLEKRVVKFVASSKISRYYGIYEQRAEWPEPESGSIPDPFGFHTHVLFEYTNTSQSITRSIRNNFRGWNVDIQYCPDKYIQSKLHYMLGEKDEEKIRKTRMDVYWRMQAGVCECFKKDAWDIDPSWTPEDDEEGDSAEGTNPVPRVLDSETRN